jgi:non-ribosomal peptide synthetase component F
VELGGARASSPGTSASAASVPRCRWRSRLDRSPELFEAVLGVLKAGGAYVALDPEAPAERLAFMVSDADAAAVLTQEHRQGVFRAGGARYLSGPGLGGDLHGARSAV